MKVGIAEGRENIELSEVYNGVVIKTDAGDFAFCMRDAGIEIRLGDGPWYSWHGPKGPRALGDAEAGLEYFVESGILPQRISPTGADDEPLSEAIICDSISGSAQYVDNMPRRLSLVRRLADGTEFRADYVVAKD